MIKVEGGNSVSSTSSSKKSEKKSSASGVSFSSFLSGTAEADEAAIVDNTTAMSGVNALFMTQMVDETDVDKEKRRKLIKRGETILDKLEKLRQDLLTGAISKSELIELAQFVRAAREKPTDPRLSAILDEIELRAEVELAKLSRK